MSFGVIGALLVLALLCQGPGHAAAQNDNYHMREVCKKYFMQDLYRKIDGAVIISQNERNLDCSITFQTHSILQRFMLRFDQLKLDCNDHLYIYDGAHAVSSYKADLSCRNTEQAVGAIYTRTNFVTLKYVTDGWGTDKNGFRLVITAVKDPKHTCKDFRCTQNEFCIETDLLCDGVNHCGDGSDESTSTLCANSEASTILGMQTTWFAVALVFLILSAAGLVTAGVLCFWKQHAATPRHPHNAHNAQTHPPVSFPWIPSSSKWYVLIQRGVSLGVRWCTDHSLVSSRQSSEIGPTSKSHRSHLLRARPAGGTMSLQPPPVFRSISAFFLLAFIAVGSESRQVPSQPFNSLDQNAPRDYFVGPCLVTGNQTCPDKEVTFFLYTRRNPEDGQEILVNGTSSNLHNTNFVPGNPTKIIVHGYDSDMQLTYLVDVRRQYLSSYDYNLIAVDWHRLAKAPCYPIVVHNVPHVGDCLGQLIARLRDSGAQDIHAIGFSLGAHVPAFAANSLRPYKIARITGLDPAMPLFVTVNNDQKLDAGDAHFVDVYHTNAFIQGKVETSGHIDFYVNGGVNQPGCWEKSNPFNCDHHRSVMYFAESINTKVGFWGWQCSGFFAYLLGLCPPRYPAVLAGDKVDQKRRGFHLLKTNSRSPYAMGNFTVNRMDMYI